MTTECLNQLQMKKEIQEEMRGVLREISRMTNNVKKLNYLKGCKHAETDWEALMILNQTQTNKVFLKEMTKERMQETTEKLFKEKEDLPNNILETMVDKLLKEDVLEKAKTEIRCNIEDFAEEEYFDITVNDLAWISFSCTVVAYLTIALQNNSEKSTEPSEEDDLITIACLTKDSSLLGLRCSKQFLQAFVTLKSLKTSYDRLTYRLNWSWEILHHYVIWALTWSNRYDLIVAQEAQRIHGEKSTLLDRCRILKCCCSTLQGWEVNDNLSYMLGYISGWFKLLKVFKPNWRADMVERTEIELHNLNERIHDNIKDCHVCRVGEEKETAEKIEKLWEQRIEM